MLAQPRSSFKPRYNLCYSDIFIFIIIIILIYKQVHDGRECKGARCVAPDDPQPIVGTRYQCQSCGHHPDMCETCMKSHNPAHILTMYRKALPEVCTVTITLIVRHPHHKQLTNMTIDQDQPKKTRKWVVNRLNANRMGLFLLFPMCLLGTPI